MSSKRRERKYAKMRTADLVRLYEKSQREVDQAFSDPEIFNALPNHEQKRMREMRSNVSTMHDEIFSREDLPLLYKSIKDIAEASSIKDIVEASVKFVEGERKEAQQRAREGTNDSKNKRPRETRKHSREFSEHKSEEGISWGGIFLGAVVTFVVLYAIASGGTN